MSKQVRYRRSSAANVNRGSRCCAEAVRVRGDRRFRRWWGGGVLRSRTDYTRQLAPCGACAGAAGRCLRSRGQTHARVYRRPCSLGGVGGPLLIILMYMFILKIKCNAARVRMCSACSVARDVRSGR